MSELARIIEALLFLSSEPVARGELAEVTGAGERGRRGGARRARARRSPPASAGSSCASWRAATPSRATRSPRSGAHAAGQAAACDADAGSARDARDRRLPGAVSRPEIARIRGVNADSPVATLLDRGLIEESGRSQFGAVTLPHDDAVPQAVRPAGRSTSCPISRSGIRRRRSSGAARAAAGRGRRARRGRAGGLSADDRHGDPVNARRRCR